MPVIRSTYIEQPDGITLDEFGVLLHETIKTIGGILGIERQIAAAIHQLKGYKVQGLTARRLVLVTTLKGLLPILTPDERTQIESRYPFVVTL